MPSPAKQSFAKSLLVALLAVMAAVAMRLLLSALVGNDAPFMPFVVAVIAAAWYGGLAPGLLTTAIGGVIGTIFFLEPAGTSFLLDWHKSIWLVGFSFIGCVISVLTESLHAARRTAEANLGRQRAAQEAASASEAHFRRALEHAPIPAALIAEDGAILNLNRTWSELSGYTLQQLPNMRDWITRATRDPAAAAAAFQRTFAVEGQRVDHGEIVGITADRREVHWDISSNVLGKLPDGRRFAICMAKDVTERHNAELATQLFRTLFDRANDTHVIVDAGTGQILYMNQNGCASLGYAPAEIEQLTVPDIAPEITPAVFAESREKMRHGEPLAIESLHRRKDGTTFPVEVRGNLVALDREYVLAVVRDISERKHAEEQLRRLSAAVESAVNGIIITDVKGTIQWVNPAFTRMTGYTSADAIGRNPRILKSGQQDRRFYTELWRTIIAGNVWRGVLCNRRKDGTLYYEDMTITPVRDAAGTITNFISIKEDVSEKRYLEQQLQQSQKLEAIGKLAGGVAHDFNNLLTVISGYSEVLTMKLAANDPMRASIKPIQEAAQRAAGLTRQLLAFSRQSVLEPKILSLNHELQEIEKMLRRMIGEDIQLTFVLDPKLNAIKADPGQIGQVLMNLAVNARDAMPKGGKLTIETANVDFDASYVADHPEAKIGHFVMLAMTDTGTGMTPDVRARIFEPFFTTKGVGQGTGLGLSVVHGIINQSDGMIQVYTELGIGTTFKLYFPVIEDAVADADADILSVKPGTETVLLVEDEDSVRGIALLALQSHGYHVIPAANAREALAIVDRHDGPIDMVVTDVVMPGMSGRELAEALRTRLAAYKLLYVSGYTDDAVVRHGLVQDQVSFLQKPYSPMGLARRVREVLDKA